MSAVLPETKTVLAPSIWENWDGTLTDEDLGAMGYSFQFITLAGFSSLNKSMFDQVTKTLTGGLPSTLALDGSIEAEQF
jgi:isocitrate lyase